MLTHLDVFELAVQEVNERSNFDDRRDFVFLFVFDAGTLQSCCYRSTTQSSSLVVVSRISCM